jgi:5-carboxymethyl-2-hydroxymuconate isomerase
MPHVVVEYSENLSASVNLQALVDHLHQSALATGVFPLGGLRTRAEERKIYKIADGHPDNSFVHVTMWLGHGRDEATKLKAAKHVFDDLVTFLKPVFDKVPLGISLNMQELDPVLNFKHNNLHDYVKRRAS